LKNLALFDFDGTLTTKDSFLEFLKYYKGAVRFYLGMILMFPWLVMFKIKLIPNWKAKEKVLQYFIGNMSEQEFKKICDQFIVDVLPGIMRVEAVNRLNFHLERGDEVIVISASPEYFMKTYCDGISVKLIATKLEVINNRITGRIRGKNCYGEEKVSRLKSEFHISEFKDIYAYGDSKGGDSAMLRVANFPYYRKFA